jgi:hypothetical protein
MDCTCGSSSSSRGRSQVSHVVQCPTFDSRHASIAAPSSPTTAPWASIARSKRPSTADISHRRPDQVRFSAEPNLRVRRHDVSAAPHPCYALHPPPTGRRKLVTMPSDISPLQSIFRV